VLDDFSTGLETNLEDSQASITRGSILDEITLNKAAEGVNAIIHLAAIGSVPRSVAAPRSSHNANATGTLNVLEAARGNSIEHVIVASSSSVYGSSTVMPRVESDVTRPLSPYAVTKLATEAYANAYHASYGLKTLALRFLTFMGRVNEQITRTPQLFLDLSPLPWREKTFRYLATGSNRGISHMWIQCAALSILHASRSHTRPAL